MIGETLGNYRVIRKLGQGGMGVVFVAEHAMIGKQAVIKVLLPELSASPDIVNRFFNEARAATLIKHPGIVDIYDFGQHSSGSAFIVMEFLEGESLSDRMRREPLPEDLAIEITRQVAAALAAAHAKGIVHRDLKPDNIFLVPDATIPLGVRAKILDFGIAKLANDVGGMKTRTGTVMGTPCYMAPEQCRGVAVDARADIYALGCIVYEMFSGRPPFLGEGPGDILAAHIYEQPQPLETRAQVSQSVATGVAHALAKNPGDRPQSMSELMAELAPGTPRISASFPVRASASNPTLTPPAAQGSLPFLTTLGAATGQRGPSVAPEPTSSGRWTIPVALIVLVGGGAGGYLWWSRQSGSKELVAAVPAAAVVAAPPVEHEPAAPSTVTIQLRSTPSGADVFRASDGVRVGKTPYRQTLPRGSGEVVYRVKLASYDDAEATLSTEHDGASDLTLERHHHGAPAHATAAPASHPPAHAPAPAAPATKPKNAIIDPFAQ